MTKNRVLRVGYIGLPVFFALLISPCTCVSQDFIGTWTCQPETRTYINSDQHIKLTFPNDKWRVYTGPHKDLYFLWNTPTKDHSSYHVLVARVPGTELFMQLVIEPTPENIDISLDEYLALNKRTMELQVSRSGVGEFDSKVIQLEGRRIGLITCTRKGQKFLTTAFKEKGRFTGLAFNCVESLFESNQDQFWAIVDSYEYLE